MRSSNPLELLLYPSTIEQTSKQEQEHPYQNGMFISINNHKTDAGKIIQQFPRQYQTLIHSVCNRKISREDIRVTKNLPPAYKISNLVASKKLIVVGGIHDYKQQDKYGNGSRTNFYHQHTHLYVYGYIITYQQTRNYWKMPKSKSAKTSKGIQVQQTRDIAW